MVYDRYQGREPRGYNARNDLSDYGPDYGFSDPYAYSSARDYQAAGQGRDWRGDHDRGDRSRGYGYDRHRDERAGYPRGDYRQQGGGDDFGRFDDGRSYGAGDDGRGQAYGSRQGFGGRRGGYRGDESRYGRRDDGDDRGFFARAGDEVRSWFGDEDAEERREQDARRDERTGYRASHGRDEHYTDWRNRQIAAFDRDYDEYRQENRTRFNSEFASFRTERQGQRDHLSRIEEHAEVVGADGAHVGTVDKVRGDRIILTKSDADASGHHHSIPSRWLQSVDGGKVTLRKTAAEAQQEWRDEERQSEGRGALFTTSSRSDDGGRRNENGDGTGGTNLNRSFSGTY